jgi:hypothetical protein
MTCSKYHKKPDKRKLYQKFLKRISKLAGVKNVGKKQIRYAVQAD